MEAASDPLEGSVRQKAAMVSPVGRGNAFSRRPDGEPSSCSPLPLPPPSSASPGEPQALVFLGGLTSCQFREVFLLLGLGAKEQDAFETNALVSPQGDADGEVMHAHDLHQTSIL